MFMDDGERRDFPLTKERTAVGRTVDCDLRVPLSSVSRRQCELLLEGNAVVLRDLGSSNGTYHNNERIQEVTLEPGDEIKVGPVVFTVVIDGRPETVAPPTSASGDEDAVAAWIEDDDDLSVDSVTAIPNDDLSDLDDDGHMTIEDVEDDSPTVIEDLNEDSDGPAPVVEAPPAARATPTVKSSSSAPSKKPKPDDKPMDDDDFADLLAEPFDDEDNDDDEEEEDPIAALEMLADELDDDSKTG